MPEEKKQSEFTAEFKESAVRLAVESDQAIAQTARDLGVNKSTLYTWINKYHNSGKKATIGDEHIYDQLKRLKKENRILREERDILKKAAAYFAKTTR